MGAVRSTPTPSPIVAVLVRWRRIKLERIQLRYYFFVHKSFDDWQLWKPYRCSQTEAFDLNS